MTDYRDTLERELERLSPPRIPFDRLAERRERKDRNQRIRAGTLGLAMAVAVGWWGMQQILWSGPAPMDDTSKDLGIFTDVRGWITYGSSGSYEGNSSPDGRWGIWAVDPANPDEPPVQLSPEGGLPIAWSSDGSKLLINRPEGGYRTPDSLVALNPDGSETVVARSTGFSGGSFTPDGSRVVYAAGGNGGEDLDWEFHQRSGIYVVDAEGGTPELVYAAGRRPEPDAFQMAVFSPSLSPDGSRIAYVEGMGDWGNSVWVMNSDGTDRRQIIGEEMRVGPGPSGRSGLQWSPDGTRLVVEGTEGIYVVDADGSALTVVARGQEETAPYWSPDGSRIAFQLYADATQEPSTKATLYSMAPDGSDVRSLGHEIHPVTPSGPWSRLGPWNPLAPEEEDGVTPTPSPTDEPTPSPTDEPTRSSTPTVSRRDGEFIVFAPSTTGSGWNLAAQDPTTGDVRTIVETDGLVDCVAVDQPCTSFIKEAEWSADGRWVAFRVTHRGLGGPPLGPCGPTVGVWVVTADGDPRQLTTPCDAPPSASDVAIEEMWAWSPVGDRLAYVRIDGETDELFVIDPSDGTRTSLGTGTVAPDYTGGWGRLTSSLTWSPDGSQIAYADGSSLYAVDVASGARSLLADSFDFRITSIEYSPDGTQLLVSHHVLDEGQCCLTTTQVMNVDGSGVQVVRRDAEHAKWSPNGDRILYQVMSDGSNVPSQVWTISPDGSDQILVFDADGCEMGNDPQPVWAPDGMRVAFDGCGTGAWVIANADGTGTPQPIDYLLWRSWYGSGLASWDLGAIGQVQ